jgi:hypothetical protein
MFPPSGQSDHPGALPGGGPPDRRGELVQLARDLAHELESRGGKLQQFGYNAAKEQAMAWVRAPDGTILGLVLAVVKT